MPNQPLALHRPHDCPHCDARDSVRTEQIIKGDSVVLQWQCSACEATWPVVRADETTFSERRSGPTDRRRTSRQERRNGTTS
jgi:transcription elongation factor Elf1